MGVPYAEVIGDPIAHSKSPLIHKFWLEKLGLDGDYRAVEITSAQLSDYLSSRRRDRFWRGCNVTIPHKEVVAALLDETDDYGIGAINCILPRSGQLIGRNTDTAGVDEAFTSAVDTSRPVCLIGAGGAARAAIASLDILAVYQFNIIARDKPKGRALLTEFNMKGAVFEFAEAEEAMAGCAGVINASPLGMTGFPAMPEAVLRGISKVRRNGFVFDMVYVPVSTPLLEAAERARLKPIDGLTMLIGQAAHAFYLFFGGEAPRRHDRRLREMLMQ